MKGIRCEVRTIQEGESVHVGDIFVLAVPRVGEVVCFDSLLEGHFGWVVEKVVHGVGSGYFESKPYQKVFIFAKPFPSDYDGMEQFR